MLEDLDLAYDASSQLEGQDYAYDALGRLVSTPERNYTWDAVSRLIGITSQGTDLSVELIYNDLHGLHMRH